MCGLEKGDRRPWGRRLGVSHVVLTLFLLGGCAYWSDDPKPAPRADDAQSDEAYPTLGNDKRPRRMSSEDKALLTEGLVADRANASHVQSAVNREGTPTRPLSPASSAAPPPTPRVASAAAPAPSPSPSPSVSAPSPVAAAPSSSDVAPPPAPRRSYVPSPSAIDPTPPPPRVESSRISENPPPDPSTEKGTVNIGSPPETFADVYARRLAEFERGGVRGQSDSPVAPSQRAGYVPSAPLSPSLSSDEQTVRLTRPGSRESGASVRSSSSYSAAARNTFLAASIDFGEGTAEISRSETEKLKEVAALAKKASVVAVRVVGRSSSMRLDVNPTTNQESNRQLAGERAKQVAAELIRLGVPSRKLHAGTDGEFGLAGLAAVNGDDATEILVDY